MAFLDVFLSWPLWGRAALVLGSVLLVLLLVRVPLLKLLSLIPLLLKWIFRAVYLLLEWLISLLHKLLGGMFYRVDNALASFGGRVDGWLERWYRAWNKSNAWNPYSALVAIAVLACYLYIILPPMLRMEENCWQTRGWSVYLSAEDTFVKWMADRGWYAPDTPGNYPDAEPVSGEPEPSRAPVQISLIVYRVPNVLAIRDIPSTEGSESLAQLPNGAVVTWNGELAFGPAKGQREPWVKVTTDVGIEGWGRLNYLYPEENMELPLVFTSAFDTASSALPTE